LVPQSLLDVIRRPKESPLSSVQRLTRIVRRHMDWADEGSVKSLVLWEADSQPGFGGSIS
jgi:hypothetical protein